MSKFKLLIVEDDKEELDTCRTTVMRYEKEKGREIELVESKTLEDAQIKINRDPQEMRETGLFRKFMIKIVFL